MPRKPFKPPREPTRMRTTLVALLAILMLAGCTAEGGQDPWAYTKKPLYAGGFDLARISGTTDAQEFRVTDGSIAAIRVLVWINATAGGATVRVFDPSGHTLFTTSETGERHYGLELGAWRVEVDGHAESAGRVHVLAVRA